MTELWVDYSAGRPGGAALKAAGITGAIRYVSAGSAGKLITAAEYADLVAYGVQVLLVYELGVHDAEGGYAQGAAHAQAALSTARAYGIPDSVGIACAADEHLTSAQVPAAVAYAQGFRDVLGQARTGSYGFAELVDAVHAAGIGSWWWKCGTTPAPAEQPWVTFWQRNTGQSTQTINGVVCDLNDQYNQIGEPEMELTDTVNVPALDASGNYNGDVTTTNTQGAQVTQTATVADLLRFSDASVRWLVEQWVPAVNKALADLAVAVAAKGATELTGTATVTIPLAPAAAPAAPTA